MKPAEKKLLRKLLLDERLDDDRWVAYIMATVAHETNYTFEPVQEAYWLSESARRRALRKYYPWHGRGFVQLTWKYNYQKAAKELNIPELATDPTLAMDWDVAYEILVEGMLEGWFTGKDLDDFINEDYCDYKRARKIINPRDYKTYTPLANLAKKYEKKIHEIGRPFVIEEKNPFEGKPDLFDEGVAVEQSYEDEAPPVISRRATSGYPLLIKGTSLKKYVRIAQQALNSWSMHKKLLVDGDFGPKTQSLLKEFQKAKGMRADGMIGQNTWNKLAEYMD
jgi:putative chitinase